jgi:hypothetical protein
MMKKMSLHNFPTEILLQICTHLTGHELTQLSLTNRALTPIAFSILSRALRLNYAYRDDRSVSQLHSITTKLKHRSNGYLSDITIAHLSWPICSELRRRMLHLLSLLPNLQTLNLKEHFGSLQGFFILDETGEKGEDLYEFLVRMKSASTIRSLKIEDTRISAHDVLKLCEMKRLEHLSIEGFNYPMGTEPTYSISSNLESLAISSSANPTGRHVDLILTRMKKLKKFVWRFDLSSILNEEEFQKALSPAAISRALKPLRETLRELDISLVKPLGFRNDGAGLDLEGFDELRVLKVHEELLFPSHEGACHGSDKQLLERLPRVLEVLEVSLPSKYLRSGGPLFLFFSGCGGGGGARGAGREGLWLTF